VYVLYSKSKETLDSTHLRRQCVEYKEETKFISRDEALKDCTLTKYLKLYIAYPSDVLLESDVDDHKFNLSTNEFMIKCKRLYSKPDCTSCNFKSYGMNHVR
jgi:hypothetical protein